MAMTRDFEIAVKYAGYREALRRWSDVDLPECIAAGINRIASGAALGQRNNLRQRFILRNKYAEGSLVYYPARAMGSKGPRAIASINAIVGSKQPFLALQEEGGTERARGKSLAMPTVAGRGGNVRSVIPNRLRIRSMGTLGARGKGSRGFFFLPPGPRLNQPAIFWRQPRYGGAMVRRNRPGQGALNKLYKIRLLGRETQQVKGRNWHRDAVERYGTSTLLQVAFIAEAKRRIAKYAAR